MATRAPIGRALGVRYGPFPSRNPNASVTLAVSSHATTSSVSLTEFETCMHALEGDAMNDAPQLMDDDTSHGWWLHYLARKP